MGRLSFGLRPARSPSLSLLASEPPPNHRSASSPLCALPSPSPPLLEMLRHPVRVLGNTRAAALVVPSSRAAATSSLAGAILDKEATASKLSEPSSSNPFGLPLPDNKYRGEVKTDTRLLPQDGKTWYSGYDKSVLSPLLLYNSIAGPARGPLLALARSRQPSIPTCHPSSSSFISSYHKLELISCLNPQAFRL